jgi:hypothetical protein
MKPFCISLLCFYCFLCVEASAQYKKPLDATVHYRTAPISLLSISPTVSHELGILVGYRATNTMKLIGGIGFGITRFPIDVPSRHDVSYLIHGSFISPQFGIQFITSNPKVQVRLLSRIQHTSLHHQLQITTDDHFWGKQSREFKIDQKYWIGALDLAILLPIYNRIYYTTGLCLPLGKPKNPFESIVTEENLFRYTPGVGSFLLLTFGLGFDF